MDMAIKKTLTGKDFCECPPCEELNAEIYPVTSDDQVILSDNGVELNNWLEVNRNGDHPTTLYDWLRLNYNQSPSITIPTASTTTLGGVIIDPTYLTINSSGLLSVNVGAIHPNINIASFDDLGIIKLGNGTVLPSDFANSTIFDTDVQIFPLRLDSNNRAGISIPNSFFSQVQSDWNQTNTNALDYIKNKPSVPAVSNASIIFRQGGSQIGSITLNQATDTVIDFSSGGGGEGGGTTYYAGTGLSLDNSIFNLKPASTNEIGGIKLNYTNNYEESGSTTPTSLTLNRKLNTTSNNDAYTQLPKILWSDGIDVSFDTNTDALTFKTKAATDTELGSIRVGYEPEQATGNRYYPVELNGDKQAYVHVPWTDTVTPGGGGGDAAYSFLSGTGLTATSELNPETQYIDVTYSLNPAQDRVLGGIRTGYTESSTNPKRYAIKVDGDGNAYVDVAWTDHTYSFTAANGVKVTTTNNSIKYESVAATNNKLGSIKVGYTTDTTNKKYKVTLDSDSNAYVNVPWSDTTYTADNGLELDTTTNTFKHKNNAITAQSTQAVYPIKIDAYGHITSYGNAVSISDTKVKQQPQRNLNEEYPILLRQFYLNQLQSQNSPEPYNIEAGYACYAYPSTSTSSVPTINPSTGVITANGFKYGTNGNTTILTSGGIITAPSTSDTYLKYNGTSFEWAAVSGGGTVDMAIPMWSTNPVGGILGTVIPIIRNARALSSRRRDRIELAISTVFGDTDDVLNQITTPVAYPVAMDPAGHIFIPMHQNAAEVLASGSSGTSYPVLSAASYSSSTSYVIHGPGSNPENKFLKGNGSWETFSTQTLVFYGVNGTQVTKTFYVQ